MLQKVISGAQTGADRGGLKAAKYIGLQTGGWMPLGFKAQDGNHPNFEELYTLKQTPSDQYPARTALNVKESDGTIRFAGDWNSRGEKLTLSLLMKMNKPYMDVNVGFGVLGELDKTIKWLEDEHIETLNIAGNSERTWPGIELSVECWLITLFEQMESKGRLLRVKCS
jgi:hypothetical protein